jgi:hypothetical protein
MKEKDDAAVCLRWEWPASSGIRVVAPEDNAAFSQANTEVNVDAHVSCNGFAVPVN